MSNKLLLTCGLVLCHLCCCNALISATAQMSIKQVDQHFHRFSGNIHFSADEHLYAWVCTITFSEKVAAVSIKNVKILNYTSTVVTVTNQSYRYGNVIDLQIEASYRGTSVPTAIGKLVNLLRAAPPQIVPLAKPLPGAKYNYNEVLQKSIMFYEAQRSGNLPEKNRIPWRHDSALQDIGENGEDLSGGWYDAGDDVKFVYPLASAVTMLNWGLIQYHDGYESSGELDNMYDCVRWGLEFLLKCHTGRNEVYVMSKNVQNENRFWRPPESITYQRQLYKVSEYSPGSDFVGEVAAAFASGYLAFKDKDQAFAAKLLNHSKQLNQFAVMYPGKYSDYIPEARKYYPSAHYIDELSWAGVWLYKATQDRKYLTQAEINYPSGAGWAMSWDDKSVGLQVILYQLTKNSTYKKDLEATFNNWLPGGGIQYTPKGLAFRDDWGSLRYSANMAFMALLAADNGLNATKYRCWAQKQIHYMLGDTGRSFVVGFGIFPPTHVHHRAASCPDPKASCGMHFLYSSTENFHVLYGALVGGPDQNGHYQDIRRDFRKNQASVDYNAGFQSAVAGLRSLMVRETFPSC